MAERLKLFSQTARHRVMSMTPVMAFLVVIHIHRSMRLTQNESPGQSQGYLYNLPRVNVGQVDCTFYRNRPLYRRKDNE